MYLSSFTRRFRDDESGAMSIGLVFAVPILVWALLSTYVYFDVFRAELISQKAGMTIADMLSREELPITEDYIDGAAELLTLLTEVDEDPELRVTVFWYDEDNDSYELSWSFNREYGVNLDRVDLNNMADRIPLMADEDRLILVETRTDYQQPISYSIGPFSGADLNDVQFETFTVIKPRFVSQFCYDDQPNSATNTLDC